MSDFLQYSLAISEKDAAYERYCSSAMSLENKQIKCRLAEVKSQYEPIASILSSSLDEREKLYAIAFYVVIGRTYVKDTTTANKTLEGEGGKK